MIRFTCPGCNATFSVSDDKGGKNGNCPKCQTRFQIPMPEEGGAPAPVSPPPPPPPSSSMSDGTIEIPCPSCQGALAINKSDLGVDLQCPYCQHVFTAKDPNSPAPTPSASSKGGSKKSLNDVFDSVGSSGGKKRGDDDEEEERPSRRSRARLADEDDDEEEERPSRRSRRRDDDDDDDDDDDYDDRPSKRKKPKQRRRHSASSAEAESAATIGLILGSVGLFLWCCPILGFIVGAIAIKKGQQAKGLSDGELGTAGVVMGYITVILSALNMFAGIILNIGGLF